MSTINKKLTVKDFKAYKLIYDTNGELKTDLELLLTLKKWRAYIMEKEHLPATCIFHNRNLVEFATYLPQTEVEFLKIRGVGKRKWIKYGGTVVGIIKQRLSDRNLGADDTIPF